MLSGDLCAMSKRKQAWLGSQMQGQGRWRGRWRPTPRCRRCIFCTIRSRGTQKKRCWRRGGIIERDRSSPCSTMEEQKPPGAVSLGRGSTTAMCVSMWVLGWVGGCVGGCTSMHMYVYALGASARAYTFICTHSWMREWQGPGQRP